MKLPVYLYGHPVLRAVSEPIGPEYPELKELVAQMFDSMYATDALWSSTPTP